MISDSAYIEIMKNCSKWNSRTMCGRTRSQTAVFDQQTGIVHRPTDHLFRHPSERCRSQNPMQVFTYPPIRWSKPKNNPSAAIEMNYFMRANPSLKSAISSSIEQPQSTASGDQQQVTEAQLQSGGINAPSVRSGTGGSGTKSYIENELDLAEYDLDELDTAEQQSDEEDWGSSRKKRKKTGTSGAAPGRPAKKLLNNAASVAAKREPLTDSGSAGGTPTSNTAAGGGGVSATTGAEPPRPYVCQLCGAKYKSRPGLAYHKLHVHQSDNTNNESPIISPKVQVTEYCDFCLGNCLQNAEGEAEPLISCHDCGRSGHPTCLKFTKNMLVSTKRYGWQCIECKSCAICGTSENDDQLLFCDDCDRGFHLYCLNPPLKEAPEMDWSCHLCVQEFGPEASIAKAIKCEDGPAPEK